jgi:hypothetical protein
VTRSQIIVLSGLAGTLLVAGLLSIGFVALNRAEFAAAQKPDLVFHTKGDQDRAVHDVFAQFAAQQGYRFKDSTPIVPPEDGRRIFDLALDKADGSSVKVRSATQTDRFFIFIYAPDATRRAVATQLKARLRRLWPDAADYRGP